ncbi:hypothetical protein ACFQ4C_30190 [Larkinella insperata]|uniref:Lipoprotein n=1 Tax=Larkinella insperata TaxID=332158 RepID=A0ABW3QJX5_9BACT
MKKLIVTLVFGAIGSLMLSCSKSKEVVVTPDLVSEVVGDYQFKSLTKANQQPISICLGSVSVQRAGNSSNQIEVTIAYKTADQVSLHYEAKIFNIRQTDEMVALYSGGKKEGTTIQKGEISAIGYHFGITSINFVAKKY